MLAYRSTWYIKYGKMAEARTLLKEEVARSKALMESQGLPVLYKARIYTPRFSPNALVLENDFASVEDCDTHWANYDADSEAGKAFRKQWDACIEQHGPAEVWELDVLN